jgi:CRISPR-associated endonuclease Csy4
MMDYYQELSLLPQEEINIHFLWSKVFQQIHLGMVEIQDEKKQVPIGVSFPKYRAEEKRFALGDKCRLFAGDEMTLEHFAAPLRLARLSDYVHCTGIRPVPSKLSGHAVYRRIQPKTNAERLARRYAKRHEINFDEALTRYSDMVSDNIKMPFVRLKSLSNKEEFCLWIAKVVTTEASSGSFSTYGLSATTTVPEF